jgi:hypothetical protein
MTGMVGVQGYSARSSCAAMARSGAGQPYEAILPNLRQPAHTRAFLLMSRMLVGFSLRRGCRHGSKRAFGPPLSLMLDGDYGGDLGQSA